MLNKETKKKLIFDIILVGTLLAVALCAFFIYSAIRLYSIVQEFLDDMDISASYVVVKYENMVIGRYSLDENGEYELNGGKNVLKIEDGKAYMIYADCPDKLCVGQGKISTSEEDIICLPNRIFVTVE